MYVYKGVWMIPATIALAIVSGTFIRLNVSQDTIFVFVVVTLSIILFLCRVFKDCDKEKKES